jgi:hypothetical protein
VKGPGVSTWTALGLVISILFLKFCTKDGRLLRRLLALFYKTRLTSTFAYSTKFYHKEMVKSATRGITAKTFSSSGDLLWSFVHIPSWNDPATGYGANSTPGSLTGLLKTANHNPFTLIGIISTWWYNSLMRPCSMATASMDLGVLIYHGAAQSAPSDTVYKKEVYQMFLNSWMDRLSKKYCKILHHATW